jgi:catechol 2,3-dioxygenase-like lactoylglutathione lyase family enzyme
MKVEVRHTFVGIPVTDVAAATAWYAHLFGRPADMFPHDHEAVWHLTPEASVYVVCDPARAGRGLLTLAVNDLNRDAKTLREGAVAFVEQDEAVPHRLVVSDADGNQLTLFQDPAAGTR